MIYTPLTRLAAQTAYEAHAGQVDKAGWPYIYHPLHVAEQVESEYEVCTALLHDVCEDTEWTLDGLRAEGFPDQVVAALALLTHDKAVSYMDYVARVKANPIAAAVKMADLRHNADLTRLDAPTGKDQERAEKYRQAYKMLAGEEMERRHLCPVCGRYVFEEYDSYDICPVCNWEDDGYQTRHADFSGGANRMSLNQAREAYRLGKPQK